jgi:hypothetical protein
LADRAFYLWHQNMTLPFPSRLILKPSVVSMGAVSISFFAWLFPSFGALRKGFDYPARFTFDAFVVLSCWYLLIFLSFSIGEKFGSLWNLGNRSTKNNLFDLNSNVLYYAFTVLAALGTAATLFRIFRTLSIQQAIIFMSLGEGNSLKEALYEDYSVGFVSFRYLVLFSAAIALYRMIRFKSFTVINILNIVLLCIGTFLLGSRLIFIATLLTVFLLVTFNRNTIRISIAKTIIVVTIVFLLLSVANYARNKNYYESNRSSFLVAGVSEILAYLGAPFQAGIGSAPVVEQLAAGGDQTYRNYVDEEITLNTNSAFVHLHEQFGFASWPYIAFLCFCMGFVFEFLLSFGKTFLLLPAGAILYGSAELWRLDLFHQGIFIVWFVMGLGLPAFLIGCKRLFAFTLGGSTSQTGLNHQQ